MVRLLWIVALLGVLSRETGYAFTNQIGTKPSRSNPVIAFAAAADLRNDEPTNFIESSSLSAPRVSLQHPRATAGLDKRRVVGRSSSLLGASLLLGVLVTLPINAHASDSQVVGQISGSGLIFKDTLTIERLDDPKVQGITLYVSNFQRPLTERLSSAKNFLQDPSYASVACVKTGPIRIADNIATGSGGEEVFEESRSLLFKTLRVQRIYDAEKKTVVYASFNTRLDKNDDDNKSRFKSSLCAVSLE